MTCYLFDIDGTIADNSHRQHLVQGETRDWKTYNSLMHLDKPHSHIVVLMWHLYGNGNEDGNKLICCTGRGEPDRQVTHDWLNLWKVPFHGLYMRADKDYRDDAIIKLEMLQRIRSDGFEPLMAFDDRDKVVKMWRENGVPCAQVAEGNF